MSLRLVTAPTEAAVSLSEAKALLRLTTEDDDALVMALVEAATQQAQSLVQRRFVSQAVEWIARSWAPIMRLPLAPVAPDGIAFIKYYDRGDVQQTLATSKYVAYQDGQTVSIRPVFGTFWPWLSLTPAAEPIVIRFTVGDDAANVDESVKLAIKFAVRKLYSASERNMFLTMERVEGVGERRFQVTDVGAKAIDDIMNSLLADQRWD
jgi:uncharacterized phiE125 gp8 family phage protein